MYQQNVSDSEIARGAAGKKQVFNSKCILIILSIALTISLITIGILFSQIGTLKDNYSSLNNKFDTNIYLNPSEAYNSYSQAFTLTPQTLDSNTDWANFLPTQTAADFMWNSQAGGYGTCKCELTVSDLNCPHCQIAIKGTMNYADFSPVYSFNEATKTMRLNFILGQGWNTLGVLLALIGDPSQGQSVFRVTNKITCNVFGDQASYRK